ncbi:MAG: sulfite exporter TauE/SafE family protein [Betaproteobacteria bacterium]|nr:sulfite exporter TauE/SafE family protein [Betaproteobacteria bacterium]
MVDIVWLLPAALAVGMLIGAVGIGGILLIPALSAFAGLGIHEAMATALFTFIFTGLTGTAMFQHRGSIDWHITTPVCVGAVLFAFLGAWVNSLATSTALAVILAGIIIFAGIYTLAMWRGLREPAFHRHDRAQQALLLAVGAISGFGSGLTGVGGPALSVPLMVLFGFPALTSIGASQVIQIIAAVSGSLGNFQFGTINFGIAAIVTLLEIAGVFAGARIVHAVSAALLRRFVALLCIAVGAVLFTRAMGSS